jgi:hypothetical protein
MVKYLGAWEDFDHMIKAWSLKHLILKLPSLRFYILFTFPKI